MRATLGLIGFRRRGVPRVECFGFGGRNLHGIMMKKCRTEDIWLSRIVHEGFRIWEFLMMNCVLRAQALREGSYPVVLCSTLNLKPCSALPGISKGSPARSYTGLLLRNLI